jgi:predicted dehydrogenase
MTAASGAVAGLETTTQIQQETFMSALRIVLVGCGGISAAWFKAIETLQDVNVVGLVDLSESAAQARKETFKLNAAVGTDLVAMLKATRPDVVFDCTVPDARCSVVMTALKHGCHVLSEKPMAASMPEARRMAAAAAKAKRLFAVMQNRRYNPQISGLRSLIAEGRLGQLTTLHGQFYIGAHFGGFRDHMRHVLLLDMAIHSFDQARLICGADPVAVYCREWNPAGSWYDHDASAVAVFEMSGGLVYTYTGSWCAEGLNTAWECSWRAIGTAGSATWDGAETFKAQVVAETGGFISKLTDVPVTVPANAKQGGHAGCIREFIECVHSGTVPETICTDNIKSLAMVFGAIRSAETGKRVRIVI